MSAVLQRVQRGTVAELDPNPRAPVAFVTLADGTRLRAPVAHAAIEPTVGAEVWVIRDHEDKPLARIVLPLAEILPALKAQELLRDLDDAAFAALVRESFEDDPELGDEELGLDGPDILTVLCQHYGREDEEQELIAEDALERALRDRILVFADSHETPDLVEDAVAALADSLLLDVLLAEEADFNDVFEALGEALARRSESAFLLPLGVNDTAILVREELAPSKLRLFTAAERSK